MQLHNLKRKTPNKTSTQVGRGGTRGKTSGKGTKGQNARAGRKKRPEIRDVIKRLPKLRGRGVSSLKSIQSKSVPVNLGDINEYFSVGDTVSLETLIAKGLASSSSGNIAVKVLGGGNLDKKLTFKGCKVSESARAKITSAGGVIE
ncbi:MAG: 50S ribosomal protein L15 [Candidatus Zambryskibacteria bacterium RIFCSPHIGHO2_01_FULL_43_27]|uniref:Large ribosomal subunit protein uL15 n=1 Tax=Candidatus Zambryskibacteria bacterium RIFCSPLOWO2_01_FULL_43_17 TaxID=1802760 RepID=A0A1G2U5W2_9BACT|nr:MAG: 50S ribosomal protein L15 [Candidatus Zambryskibacteria bacterium RIFCSPHIGHO2_01_FULL_43_27]OHB00030.1 MAG: 50S ribosomal protein L15 [Candidatus Zambryskibacteria bacterium RIFCSPHIGHO2_12_FULL_43_12b]OHB04262.1 MAG: 50S ribosomal protein L15 [Candidatus Zambryskibacteria bacterium RIFCSPLOWO2_01_FULL_43_17]